jgi:enamine deaminase RidA (YjgF/YER057c/UK114 family)
MAGTFEAKLKQLGHTLPDAPPPAANYVPYVVTGKLVFVAGQVSRGPGGFITGKLGRDLDVERGQEAARVCALNILAQVKAACGGDLDRVVRCVKVGRFVNCVDIFEQQPQVINGCSDLFVAVLGDKGKHARFAVGANILPFNAAVEIDAVFEIA